MRFDAARRSAFFAALLGLFLFSGVTLFAQDNKTPQISKKEADLAKKLQEGTDVGAKLKLAEKFVKDFPDSPNRVKVARYIAGQIGTVTDLSAQSVLVDAYLKTFSKPEESDFIAPTRVEFYTKSGKNDEAFKLGGEYLSRRPTDFLVALHLLQTGTMAARGGVSKFNAQCRDFAQKAIAVATGGSKPEELSDDEWTKAKGPWLGQVYQSLGFIATSERNDAEALTNFKKATEIDDTDVNSWVMYGYTINTKYQSLARESQLASGAQQTELRKKAEAELDKVIEIYARVVAMTDGNAAAAELNGQIKQDLEVYYKYRHGGKLDGLQQLIESFRVLKIK